jgi:glycosyltransferase involved in cell wall biosynthesis
MIHLPEIDKQQICLSIIIPFYNVEKYIGDCLDSVYAQDVPESMYEVICVNDCSPDNSREIVLKYQQEHTNLLLIEHKKNQKQCEALNTGLRAARGKYVWFIDSDDFIRENVFGRLLNIVEKNEIEILQFGALRYKKGKLSEYYGSPHYESDVITGYDYLNFDQVAIEYWSKIYLKDFLLANNLFFLFKDAYPDQAHTIASLLKVKRFKFIEDKVYFYRYREDSIMGANSPVSGTAQSYADITLFSCACIELLDKHKDKDFFAKRIVRYTREFDRWKKVVWNLPFKEKIIFCTKLYGFNRQIIKKYLPFKIHSSYTYPFLIFAYKILYDAILLKRRILRFVRRLF